MKLNANLFDNVVNTNEQNNLDQSVLKVLDVNRSTTQF